MTEEYHCSEHITGGTNIYRLAEELRTDERKIIDFSSPVNPLGVSNKVKAEMRRHMKSCHHYPDPATGRLTKRLSQYHNIERSAIICGNGSTELLQITAAALKPLEVILPIPCPVLYQFACQCPCVVFSFYQLKKEEFFDIDAEAFIQFLAGRAATMREKTSPLSGRDHTLPAGVIVLSNPGNPAGRLLTRENVLKIAEAAERLGYYLILDEAFMDYCANESVIDAVKDYQFLIVLRSMSSFYALAGLRIGYGAFPPDLIRKIEEFRIPWTVNSLAQRAAIAALKDDAYRRETVSVMKNEKDFFEANMKHLGIEYIPSRANFYLIRTSGSEAIAARLKAKGIILGNSSKFVGLDRSYLRIAVRSHRENALLMKELKAIFKTGGQDAVREMA